MFIVPAPSGETPIAALGLCAIRTYCQQCGPREQPVQALFERVPRATTITDVFARLRCETCGQAPSGVEAVNSWIAEFGRVPETCDLSHLLPSGDPL